MCHYHSPFFLFHGLLFSKMTMVDYSRIGPLLNILVFGFLVARTEALFVGITLLKSAVAKGAVCLDGSPPAYHLDKGFGTGINSWLVHLEGGGWCHNVTACQYRKNTRLGSSKYMENSLPFSGILNNKQRYNPDFYNWNRVKIRYCDGSSFTGDVQKVDPATNLHFRGARIWVAVIKELLSLGMYNAENAFLSGCSAGGLAAIMHCDSFKAMLPMGTNVKCLSDGGYFVNVKDISRGPYIQNYFSQIVSLHGSAKNLPLSCTSKTKPALCFFPQNVVPQIKTPLFILNSAYDSWQINNILAPGAADPHGAWKSCKFDYSSCSSVQINTMQEFRKQFLFALLKSSNSSSRGIFIDSCYAHCQTELQELWFMPQSPALGKTKVAKAVGDWFYDRSPCKKIDCPYPCNPTCPIHGLSPRNQEKGSQNRNPTGEYTVLMGILWCWLLTVELGLV